jgi:5-methylcytosine-specific restriction endonuclease McrA
MHHNGCGLPKHNLNLHNCRILAIMTTNYSDKTNQTASSTLTAKYPRRARFGRCPLCLRKVDLTFHHLIPKKMHRRTFFKKAYSKQVLAQGIDICRKCHTGLHKTYDEMELAKSLNTLEAIAQDEVLANHFAWVAKQKVQKS